MRSTLSIAAALLALACGGARGTCEIDTSAPAGYTYCINYSGVNWNASAIMTDCSRSAGTYSAEICMTETGGTCTFNGGTETETKQLYYAASGSSDGGVPFRDICTVAGGFYDAP